MIEIPENEARVLVQFLSRVQLQATEAATFVKVVSNIEQQLVKLDGQKEPD